MYEVTVCEKCGEIAWPNRVPDGYFEYRLECPGCGQYLGYETHSGCSYVPEEDTANNQEIKSAK
jgi:ribosomal protein L32